MRHRCSYKHGLFHTQSSATGTCGSATKSKTNGKVETCLTIKIRPPALARHSAVGRSAISSWVRESEPGEAWCYHTSTDEKKASVNTISCYWMGCILLFPYPRPAARSMRSSQAQQAAGCKNREGCLKEKRPAARARHGADNCSETPA